jgi:hypothetical protein
MEWQESWPHTVKDKKSENIITKNNILTSYCTLYLWTVQASLEHINDD